MVQRTIYDGVALSEEMHEKEHFFRSGSYKSDPSVALSCSLTRNPCDERNGPTAVSKEQSYLVSLQIVWTAMVRVCSV